MRVDIINRMEALAALRGNWDAVYAADPEAQFFLSWTWISGFVKRSIGTWFVLAARPDDSSDYVAFFPLSLQTKERQGGVFRNVIWMAGNFGADYTGFICQPGCEAQAIPAFGQHLRRMHWAALHLENVRASDERFALLIQNLPKSGVEYEELNRVNRDNVDNAICPAVPLPADWDAYLDTRLSANTRQKIRRLLRQLDRSDTLRITHATPETIQRDLDILLGFWAKRWGPRKGKRLQAILASNRLSLQQACASATLHMPVLWQGERPLGANGCLVDTTKKALLFLLGARDETFNTPSPGLVLHAHSLRWAIANGFKTYDFLRGNEPYKYSFGPEETRIKSVVVRSRDGKNLGDKLEPDSLAAVFRRATELHKQNQLTAAEHAYKQVLATAPDSKGALYGLGQLLAKRGDHFAAKRLFRRLLEIEPGPYKTWFRLARTLVARGEFSEAAEAFCEVVEREPKFVNGYYELGCVLLQLGLPAQAVAAFEATLGLKADFPDAEAARTRALQQRSNTPDKQLRRSARKHADIIERVAALAPIAAAARRYQRSASDRLIVAKGVLVPGDIVGPESLTGAEPAALPN